MECVNAASILLVLASFVLVDTFGHVSSIETGSVSCSPLVAAIDFNNALPCSFV